VAVSDTTIDGVQNRGEILKKLDQLERTARAKGFAVGTGTAFDLTVETVAAWANEAKARGIEIVPISAVANDPAPKGTWPRTKSGGRSIPRHCLTGPASASWC